MTFRRATRDAPSDRFPSAKAFASSIRHRYRSTIIFSAVIAAIVITAGLYPVWKPPLADYLRPLLNPPEKVLGVISQKENENDVDYFNRIKPLAENGNVEAEIALAEAYFYGRGVVEDRQEAIKWYTKAAEAGDLSAMNGLAYSYLHGFGVEKDPFAGFNWALKAAERGHHPSQTMVAECYLDGIGVEKNIERAETWLYRAARLGNKRAQMLLRTR